MSIHGRTSTMVRGVIVGLAVAVGATACAGLAAQRSDSGPGVFKVGIKPADSTSGFLNMADHKRFYQEYGCDVQLVELRDSSSTMNALISGDVDAIEESPSQFFIAAQTGNIKAKIIGSWMAKLPYALYTSKDITSFDQIAGRNVAISSPTGLPAIVAKEMLKAENVDLSGLHYVNAGGNADRYRAVVSGTADVAASPADYVPMAEKDGVNVLALSVDTVPDYPRSATIALQSSLDEKPDCAKAYLAGSMKGSRYAYDHPDEAKQLAADLLSSEPEDPMVTYMYDEIKAKNLVSPDAEVSMESLNYLASLLIDLDEVKEEFRVDEFVDDSYRVAAKQTVDQESAG